MNRLPLVAVLLLASSLLGAHALAATPQHARTAATASTRFVALRDGVVSLSSATAPHGTVTFVVTNRGTVTHNIRLQRVSTGVLLFKSAGLAPGQRITFSRTLAAGKFRLFCSIHVGMTHAFTVS